MAIDFLEQAQRLQQLASDVRADKFPTAPLTTVQATGEGEDAPAPALQRTRPAGQKGAIDQAAATYEVAAALCLLAAAAGSQPPA